ncbi:MAG: tRNA dihydrouridine synthase DusB [Treponema sp.]|nr:tRNA dihydrouridine synthase DusB [Treponema sp.]MBP5752909.1 tRNA dihydrouridine synthase DusB [Treponema sp.]
MTLYHPVSIGDLELPGNLFLAPIAGYSDRAFRSLCIEQGASFCTTEMVSAEALTRGSGKTQELMLNAPNEKKYAVQLFGGNADVVARAAVMVLEQTPCSAIDINGGCPVPKIVKSGAGSMLTKEPDRLFAIVSATKKAVKEYSDSHPERGKIPVTIKIRSGWDAGHMTWRECTLAALEAGADAITIHARTRAQGYEGKADWNIQRQLVELVDGRIPVFGSGDAHTPETARKMLEETGVDGVMFARGAMGDPFLFKRTIQYLTTGEYQTETIRERLSAGFRELELNIQDKGEKAACLLMRKKFCAYSSGIRGGAQLRQQVVHAESAEDYRRIFASSLE